jgi:hypothetical protein
MAALRARSRRVASTAAAEGRRRLRGGRRGKTRRQNLGALGSATGGPDGQWYFWRSSGGGSPYRPESGDSYVMSDGGQPVLKEKSGPERETVRLVVHEVAVKVVDALHGGDGSPATTTGSPVVTAPTSAVLSSDQDGNGPKKRQPTPLEDHAKKATGLAGVGIGDIGDAAVDRKVFKAGAKSAQWKVLKAEQEKDGWRYQVQHGFTKETKWVQGSDAGYELAPQEPRQPLTREQRDISATLRRHLSAASPRVDTKQWMEDQAIKLAKEIAQEKNVTRTVDVKEVSRRASFADIAASPAVAAADVPIIWSGGASDCIIVAGISGKQARLEHLDNVAVPSFTGFLTQCSEVYVVSEKFKFDPDTAVGNEFVCKVISRLVAGNVRITAIYPAKQLAINVATGEHGTDFDVNPLKNFEMLTGDMGDAMLGSKKTEASGGTGVGDQ